jgi:hypothetical protein
MSLVEHINISLRVSLDIVFIIFLPSVRRSTERFAVKPTVNIELARVSYSFMLHNFALMQDISSEISHHNFVNYTRVALLFNCTKSSMLTASASREYKHLKREFLFLSNM